MATKMLKDQPPGSQKLTSKEITPELVQKISERVIAMLINELKIEKERFRTNTQWQGSEKGRHYGG